MKKYKLNKSILKTPKTREVINKRFNILIYIIIIITLILSLNLFSIQILNNEFYTNKLEKLTLSTITSDSTPRGRIYDRNGNILVDNEAVKVIFYKKPSYVTTAQELETAEKLSEILTLTPNLTELDLKNYYLIVYKEEANNLITEEEWQQLNERKLTSDDITNLKIERITSEIEIFTDKDKLIYYIYKLMNTGYSYDEKIIKNLNVTDEEYANVSENIAELNGVNIKLDWNRVYPYGSTFKSILGSVSTKETGIPYELKDYYLSQGYSLDDRVGTSYLEYQYESILKGEKTVYEVLSDGETKVLYEGSRGNDIVLSIDINLQIEVEKIIEEQLLQATLEPNTENLTKSFVIISDPNTGEILAMASKQLVYNESTEEYKVYDYTPGVINDSVTPGSIVKGASHIVGYNTGALQIDERRTDSCIKIQATPLKCSWTTLGTMNDLTALKYSSNVFQYKTAINVGGGYYQYDKALYINAEAFTIYRNTYAEFGLGTYTGIDLPNEGLGYKGTSVLPGHLLDFSIGQYDTYTPIQISQYINTIANGGNRITPTLLKAVYEPTKEPLTSLLYETIPTIINKVNTEDIYMERIQEGFKEVMTTSGTGVGYLDYRLNSAGKTGTSESFVDTTGDGLIDTQTTSKAFVGYAPYDNPEVTFTILSPNTYTENPLSSYSSNINQRISYQISQKYFELYK